MTDELIDIGTYMKNRIDGELYWSYADGIGEFNTTGKLSKQLPKIFWGIEHSFRYIEEQDKKIKTLETKVALLMNLLGLE